MPIIFEPDRGMKTVYPFYQKLARDYFIGKKFDSLDDAFKQKDNGSPISSYFEIERVSVKPENLPLIIQEAEIKAIFRDEQGITHLGLPEFSFPVLKARFISSE